MLESEALVAMTAETGSKHEATRGDTNFLPKSPHNRSKDLAAEAAAARRRGGRPRVLMAIEPRAYREGIAAVISQLRPEVEIEIVERIPWILPSSASHPPWSYAARPRTRWKAVCGCG